MIFKQINSSVDETRKTLALFNKDWDTYKSNWQNANGIRGKIGSIFTSSNANTSVISNENVQILRNWNNAVAHGCTNQETFNRIITNADENTKMYFAGLNKGKGSIEGLKNAQNVATQSTIGLTIAQTALNMAISLGLTALISLFVKGYDELANSVENCKKRVDDLISSYKSALDTANSNANKVKELADRYEKLSKGVNNLGENISLTNDEYKEYNSLVNEIAEMFPTLVQGWTDEGNAILNLKGNVEQLRDAYKEAQQEAYNLLITSGKDSDGNDIIKQWEDTHDTGFWADLLDLGADDVGGGISISDALKQLKAIQNMTAEEYREIERITGSGSRKEIAELSDIEKEIGYGSYLYKALGLDSNVSDEEFREAQRQAKALAQTYNAEIESALSDVETLANAYLMTNEDYDKLDAQSKTAASMIVNSLNTDIANGFSSKEDVGVYVDKIIQSILSNDKAKEALTNLFTMDTSDMPIGEIEKQTDSYISIIAEVLKENPIELKARLGFDDSNTEPLIKKVKSFLSNEFDNKVSELTLEELDIASELEIPEGTLLSWDELIAKIKEVQSSTLNDKNPISLSLSQTIDQLNTQLKPAMDSLKSAWQDIFTDDGFALNSIDILSTCDSIKSKLDDMAELGLDIDYSAYEHFVYVLNSSDSTVDDVKDSFNQLATSITQAALSGTEDFETMKAALEDLGVINSELVAFDALINNTELLEDTVKQAGLTMDEFVISTDNGKLIASEAAIAFLEEMVGAENCTQALALLQLKQLLINQTTITTTDDCQNVLALAQAANIGIQQLQQLQTLMDIITQRDAAVQSGDSRAVSELNRAINELSSNVVSNLNLDNVEVNFGNIGGGKSAASKAGKEAGDAYLDAFEKELKELDDLRSNNLISEKEYLDRLRVLYERYFKDKLGYEKEFANYQQKYLDGYKSLYESVFSHASKVIGDRIDAINDEKDSAIDSLEAQKKAAEDSYNAQIKLLENKKDALQVEIDKINEANEDRRQAIDLQKSEYELARMQNQRTILQYSEDKGAHFVTDTSGIRDARNDLDDKKADAQIRALEKQQDALDKQIDAIQEMLDASNEYWDTQIEQTEKYYDAMIHGMEEYKSRWEELSDLQEHAEMIALLEELGYTEKDLADAGSGAFDRLRTSYLGILKDMNDGNQGVLDGLSRLANIDMGNIPSFLAETQGYIDSIANMDVTALSDGLNNVCDGFSNVADSASSAASAISGGNVSPVTSTGNNLSGKGSANNKKNNANNGSSLKDAITEVSKGSVDEISKISAAFAGENEEGASVTGAVQKVMDKIGSADSDNENTDSLMYTLKEQTDAALNEESGIPAQITAWEELITPLGESADLITTLQSTLADMDGKEFTVTLNVVSNGSPNSIVSEFGGGGSNSPNFPSHRGDGFVQGTAHIESTANASGNWGVKKAGRSLVGELGQELWVHSKDGTFETVGDNGAEFINIKPNDIIFNHLQTKQLLDKGNIIGRGRSYANGTALVNGRNDEGWITLSDGLLARPLQEGDKGWDLMQKFQPLADRILSGETDIMSNAMIEHQRQMEQMVGDITNMNVTTNNKPSVTIGDIHVTCPGVTSKEVAKQVGVELNNMFSGLHLDAMQQSMMR